jgi:hypothetical protein
MRRAVALVVCWQLLLAGGHRVHSDAATPGGTTFSSDGTMHVNIDLYIGGFSDAVEPLDPTYQPVADTMAKDIEDYWNQGLAAHPVGDCGFTLRLDVDIDAVDPDSVHVEQRTDEYLAMATNSGRHTIGWSEGSGIAGSNPAWPEVYDPYDLDQEPGHDSTSPWQHDLDGMWSPYLEDARDFAHEAGHLMGLGDDYADDSKEVAPGREGTLMGDGDGIDQALADRLADVMRRAGIQLPQCWKGSGEFTSTATYPDAAASTCRDAWSMQYTFVVDPAGVVAGSGVANREVAATCPFPTPGAQWEVVRFNVLGQRDGDTLSLELALAGYEPTDGIDYAGFGAPFWSNGSSQPGAPVTFTVVDDATRGPAEWSFQSGSPPATYATTGTLAARCIESC